MASLPVCTSCHHSLYEQGGVARCGRCGITYPVICGIPILFDMYDYLAQRHSVGLQMLRLCTGAAHDLVTAAMSADDDSRGAAERRWAAIYQSGDDQLYRHILDIMPRVSGHSILEHGCSVGRMSRLMGGAGADVTGVDISFPALHMAARQDTSTRYVAADSAIFPGKFDIVVALNMLELIEPRTLINAMASGAGRYVVLADPYDYMRGARTVSGPLYSMAVRSAMRGAGFDIVCGTQNPLHIPWTIRISPRTSVQYMVDVVIGETR